MKLLAPNFWAASEGKGAAHESKGLNPSLGLEEVALQTGERCFC